MKLIDLSIHEFMEEVDSKKPAPGGGSVSALASTLGVGLSRMVGHLTISKKSFDKLDEFVQSQFHHKMEALLTEKEALLQLIDEDTAAFNQMMVSFKLPKDTEEEKTIRSIEIQKATLHGIEVPKAVCKHSLVCLRELPFFVKHGNKSAISDIGVGALMLSSGIEGAILNMKINLPGIEDQSLRTQYWIEIEDMMNEMKSLRSSLLEQVHLFLDAAMI